jgi:tetratricopeptide (TPR) repeat protein
MKHEAEAAFARSDNAATAEMCTKIIATFPRDTGAYILRGLANARLNHDTLALKDFDAALKLNPHRAEAWLLKGDLLTQLKKSREAIRSYQGAVLADSSYAALKGIGENLEILGIDSTAIVYYSLALGKNASGAELFNRRATLYSKAGHDEQAIFDYSKAIALNPAEVNNYINRASCFYRLKNYPNALADCQHGFDLHDSLAAYVYGLTKEAQGKKEEAIRAYSTIIRHYPKESEAYYRRGLVEKKLKKTDRACTDFITATALGNHLASLEVLKCK